jgi:hypothetical protein
MTLPVQTAPGKPKIGLEWGTSQSGLKVNELSRIVALMRLHGFAEDEEAS